MYCFEKLLVWQRAHGLAVAVLGYLSARDDPRLRILAHQAWRAACSIGANIAEGAGSASHAQFARFLGMALSSAYELENHLRVARDAALLDHETANVRIGAVVEVKKMLWSLREKVRRDPRGKRGSQKENDA